MRIWRALVVVFVVFMIVKDVIYAPTPHVLRAVAQGLCLAAGGAWLLQNLHADLLSRYWPVFAYGLSIICSAMTSSHPGFVFLQALSLASVMVFFIAYFEKRQSGAQIDRHTWLLNVIVVVYGLIAITSLVLAKWRPGLAYEELFAGFWVDAEVRFKGVFGKAGGMGQAAGLLLGFSGIAIRRWWLKVPVMIAAAACLALTQSRSFWIGSLLAGSAVVWLYFPRWKKKAAIGLVTVSGILGAYYTLSGHVDVEWFKRAARVNTLATLTGRTHLWEQAGQGIAESPWIGFGFTLGSTGMPENRALAGRADVPPTELSRVTLHNGYIQSLMDTGVIGTFFYLATILVSVSRLLRNDTRRQYPQVLYAVLFLAISNLGESVIYSGSMFPSLCFWLFAIAAMSLKGKGAKQIESGVAQTPCVQTAVRPGVFSNLLP